MEKGKKFNIKKTITKFLYFTLAVSIGFVFFIIFFAPEISSVNNEEFVLGAHRGNSINYMENTLEAFESALNDDKYKFIEFDVQFTKDKKLIVYHDKDLLRIQGQPYEINDITYEGLNNISAYHIPLYIEVMELIRDKKPINIEIKSQGNLEDDKNVVDYLIEDLKNREILETTLISSPLCEIIEYIEQNHPDIKTGKVCYIVPSSFLHLDITTKQLYEEMERINADYLVIHGSNLRNYESLTNLLPEEKTLIIWYFTDEIYIINPKWKFGGRISSIKPLIRRILKKEPCIWWC